jgi:long-chain acyl-CoA synthetase
MRGQASMSATTAREAAEAARAEPKTLWEFIERAIVRYADAPALALRDVDPEIRWTYRDLGERIEAAAGRLAARGISRGDRVMLWGANRPEWGAAFFALLRLGAVAVPLDLRSASDFVQKVAQKTRPRALLADSDLSQGSSLEAVPRILIEDLTTTGPAESGSMVQHEGSPQDLVEIVFTSGTTGEPKGVMITNRNLLANVHAMDLVVHLQPGNRLVSLLPLSHLFEQTVGLMDVLGSGACSVYLHSMKPDRILEAIREERATMMLVVPQVLDLFLQGIEREVRRAGKQKQWELLHGVARRLPFGLRRHLFRPLHQKLGGRFDFFVTGGAPLDPELGRVWENMGIKILQGYGTTEATPGISATRLDDRSIETVGWPIEGIELKIAPDGEVLIRGPQVMPGYWEDPQATAAAFEDGWYRTGDLGELDERGRLRLRGRKKNMIVLGNGQNVYPEDVETVLRLHPAIKDAVVIGLRRGRSDVDLHAVLVLHDAHKAGEAVKAANRRLAPHQQIRGQSLWPEEDFPRTLTLKPRRPLIEEWLSQTGVGQTA